MDAELKAVLRALADGQINLAEKVGKMADAQKDLSRDVKQVVRAQKRTDASLKRVGDRLERVGDRLDQFARAVIRGFTNGAGRERTTGARINALDSRVTALERAKRS